jgi:hypothetical protein
MEKRACKLLLLSILLSVLIISAAAFAGAAINIPNSQYFLNEETGTITAQDGSTVSFDSLTQEQQNFVFINTHAQSAYLPEASDIADIKESDDIGFFGFSDFFNISSRIDLWKRGFNIKNTGDLALMQETMKYFIFIMIVILIYSSLKEFNLPSSAILKWIIAFLGGFLGTIAITTKEFITMLFSYTAMGVVFSVFFPIAILLFFSMVVAKRASPIGIRAQQIIWIIYGAYLGFKTLFLMMYSYFFKVVSKKSDECIEFFKLKDSDAGICQLHEIPKYLAPFISKSKAEIMATITSYDNIMLIVLLITSIAVIAIMGFGNKYINNWLMKEEREAAIEAQREELARARAESRNRAGDLMSSSTGK